MKKILTSALVALATLALTAPLTAQSLSKDPITIKWSGTQGKPNPDTPVVKLAQEKLTRKLGYQVTFELLGGQQDADYNQARNIWFASGDLPDVLWMNSLSDEKFNLGAVARFSMDEFKTYMPQNYAYLDGLMTKLNLDKKATWAMYQDEKGQFFGVPKMFQLGYLPYGAVWRQDVLTDLGIKSIPSTLAEVEKAFIAYKAKYPTKYPYNTYFKGLAWQFGDIVFAAYGVDRRGQFIKGEDGKYIRSTWDPNTKKALAVLADWIKKGYIDPEFFTYAQADSWNIWKKGDGLLKDYVPRQDLYILPGGNNEFLQSNVAGAKVVTGPNPTAVGGKLPLKQVWFPFLTQYIGFGKQLAKDPAKLHKIMQVYDTMGWDKEINMLLAAGVEGKHYTIPAGLGFADRVATPEFKGKPGLETVANEGHGYYWNNITMGYANTLMPELLGKAVAKNVEDPNGMFSQKYNFNSFSPGALWRTIEDEKGNDLSKPLLADTSINFDNVIAPILLGAKPVTYFDEMYQRYLKIGGDKEELYANKMITGK